HVGSTEGLSELSDALSRRGTLPHSRMSASIPRRRRCSRSRATATSAVDSDDGRAAPPPEVQHEANIYSRVEPPLGWTIVPVRDQGVAGSNPVCPILSGANGSRRRER